MLLGSLALLLTGCAGVRYLGHVTRGEVSLLLHRRPVTRVLADPSTPPALARRLDLAQQARRFASDRLGLPRNRSYTSYVALDRPWVAWNVFAAPRFGIDALPQCFPFAGCVAYRGYFRKDLAEAQAARRRALGDDVWIGPVPAFSTLGWFADPLLSPMLRWDEDTLAGTIFHELSHQAVYVKGDTAFNESFASFVEREGLAQWRIARGLPPADDRDAAMDAAFTRHVLALRERLAAIYAASDAGAAAMARRKAEAIADFRRDYARWRDRAFPHDHRYDAWVDGPINNAKLLPFGLYDRWVPAFAALFARVDRDWPAFYGAVRALGRLPGPARERRLAALAGGGSTVQGASTAGDPPAGEHPRDRPVAESFPGGS